jgi:Flp pilus assembly pilin Flp
VEDAAEQKGRGLMKPLLRRAVVCAGGLDLIEYSLLIGNITVARMLAMAAIGGKITQYFANLNVAMP